MKTQERDRVIVRSNEGKNDEESRWEKERTREGMKITSHDFLLVWTKQRKKNNTLDVTRHHRAISSVASSHRIESSFVDHLHVNFTEIPRENCLLIYSST